MKNPLVSLILSCAAGIAAFQARQLDLAVQQGPASRRSKGRGIVSGKKWGSPPAGWYDGVSNGVREVVRRRRQLMRKQMKDAARRFSPLPIEA